MSSIINRMEYLKLFYLLIFSLFIGMNAYAIGGSDFHTGQVNYTVDNDISPAFGNVGMIVYLADDTSKSPGDPDKLVPFTCTGTLISPTIVLTAGHCTLTTDALALGLFSPNLAYVKTAITFHADAQDILNSDGSDLNPALDWHEISYDITAANIGVLPNFYALAQVDSNDVGVSILKEPITDIAPANIPALTQVPLLDDNSLFPRPEPNGVAVNNVGYGVEDTILKKIGPSYIPAAIGPKNELGGLGLRRFGNTTIANVHDGHIYPTEDVPNGETGTCFGDSGGPLFATHPATGQPVVLGVLSSGAPGTDTVGVCGVMRSFYPRIDTAAGQEVLSCTLDKIANNGNPCDCDWIPDGCNAVAH